MAMKIRDDSRDGPDRRRAAEPRRRPRAPRIRIAVVHTRLSPCRCHEFFLRVLRGMGFDPLDVPVESPGLLREAARSAALVVEHTDTFRGRGDLRPLIRHRIEALGGRLVGTPALAAHAADDKIEAQRRLEEADLRVPRSVVLDRSALSWASPAVRRGVERRISRLRLPLILKRPFEHGSRGVRLLENRAGLQGWLEAWLSRRTCVLGHARNVAGGADAGERADSATMDIEARSSDVLLAQQFVGGRELAAGVVEVGGRPVCLPVVEVDLGRSPVYGKRTKWGAAPLPIRAAQLAPEVVRRLASETIHAFDALGLRDYARFDVRLRPCGEPVFLEVNVRPSVEDGTELRLAAGLAGLSDEELLALILSSAARRHGLRTILRRLRKLTERAEERLLASGRQ